MTFIVLDTWGEPIVCTNEDGITEEFDTYEEADAYGKENCQSHKVVEL